MTPASLLGILVFLIGPPCVAGLLFVVPKSRRPLLMLLTLSICYITKPFYQEVLFSPYRGVDRGFGVTVPDIIFFGFFLYILFGGNRKYKTVWLPYNATFWILLIVISILSVTGSAMPLYSFFTIHKFVRCLVLYWVVVNIVRTREEVQAIITMLIATATLEGVIVFWTKYVTKTCVYRSMGTFKHPNRLAMYMSVILPIILALVLSGKLTKKQNLFAAFGILSGFAAVLFTKSRASAFILPAIFAGVTFVSIMMKPTFKKTAVAIIGIVAVGSVLGLAIPKLMRRFETAPKKSAETRVHFNNAARAMANDHFFGVGINMYSWSLRNTEYYWHVYPEGLEEDDPELFREINVSRLGTAHHVYYLFAAEIGWLGMWVFVLYIARFYLLGVIQFFKAKDQYYKSLFLGLLAGFGALYVQGLLEWFLRMTDAIYLFTLLAGLMVAAGAIDEVFRRAARVKAKRSRSRLRPAPQLPPS